MQFGGKLALFAVCWLLIAPTALAGTESDPEIDDHADKSSPSADLLSAWFEPHPTGVKFTVKIAGTPNAPKDHLYYVMFRLEGRTHLMGIAMDRDERLQSYAGPNNFNGNNVRGPETFDSPLRQVGLERGAPAYASAIIPWGIVAGFEPGNVLTDLTAGTALYGRQSGSWSDADIRVSENAFVLERTLVPREVSQVLPLILALFAAGLVSSIATALLVRWGLKRRAASARTRALAPSYAPPSVLVEEPPPAAAPKPPAPPQRFTLRPPHERKPPG